MKPPETLSGKDNDGEGNSQWKKRKNAHSYHTQANLAIMGIDACPVLETQTHCDDGTAGAEKQSAQNCDDQL